MKKIQNTLATIFTFLSFVNYGQTIGDGKLDKYYSEGEESFARFVTSTIQYPQQARKKGTMGLAIFSFRIDCQNQPTDFVFENKLGNGIEEEIEKVIKTTQGSWVSCNDRDQQDRVKLNFAFSIKNYYDPPNADLVIVAYGSFPLVTDEKLEKQYDKALKKGKLDKAKEAVDELIKRYPSNSTYLKEKDKVELMMKN